MLSDLRVSCAPHISERYSTRAVMADVIIGLAPAMIAAVYYFRQYALILITTCVISAVVTEWLCNLVLKKENPLESLGDLSAVVTGIILALSLPPALPVWAAVIGSCFAIAIGKMVFGGLGSNIFNPAMAGRAFLTACFGILMTTWTVPATVDKQMPVMSAETGIHARTQATPLAWSKQAIKSKKLEDQKPVAARQGNEILKPAVFVDRQLRNMFLGSTGGCLGETSALAMLLGGIYLLIRKTITWRIPLAVLASAFVFGLIANLINPTAYISPFAHLTAGGMMLCAFFIATDPVTAPLTGKGMWIFGIGVGAVTMLIRIVGEYPEGIMYAVLLMNAVTPLIDRFCKLTPTGGRPNV